MLPYILRRLLGMIPLFLGITIVSFLVIHLAPGSPVTIQTDLNPKMTAEARERLRKFYGLDKPLHIQYYNWVKHLATLDLGRSFSSDGRPVLDKIQERLSITIFINILSILLIFLVAIPLGIFSAVYQNSLFDRSTTVFVFIGFAIPTFWLALLLMILFGIHLGWLPISGLKSINYEYLSPLNQLKDRAAHAYAGAYFRFWWISRTLPVFTIEHAGNYSPGLYYHCAGKRAFGIKGDIQACSPECAFTRRDYFRSLSARAYRRERYF